MNNDSTIFYEDLDMARLWVDGDRTLNMRSLKDKLLKGEEIDGLQTHISEKEIRRFKGLTGIELASKDTIKYENIDSSINLEEKYKNINLEDYFFDSLYERAKDRNLGTDDIEKRVERIYDEIQLFSHKGLEDVLRLSIKIVKGLQENDIVWGPGRGSSCASYLLYLVGIHDVDSVMYDLDVNEFLR